jgi:hypothetical protein
MAPASKHGKLLIVHMGCRSRLQVYIGNLVGGLVTEEALRQLFNNTMAAAFPDQVCAQSHLTPPASSITACHLPRQGCISLPHLHISGPRRHRPAPLLQPSPSAAATAGVRLLDQGSATLCSAFG